MKAFNPIYLLTIVLALLGCEESSDENQFKPLNFDTLTLSARHPRTHIYNTRRSQ